jgi:hypothetical protein
VRGTVRADVEREKDRTGRARIDRRPTEPKSSKDKAEKREMEAPPRRREDRPIGTEARAAAVVVVPFSCRRAELQSTAVFVVLALPAGASSAAFTLRLASQDFMLRWRTARVK